MILCVLSVFVCGKKKLSEAPKCNGGCGEWETFSSLRIKLIKKKIE